MCVEFDLMMGNMAAVLMTELVALALHTYIYIYIKDIFVTF